MPLIEFPERRRTVPSVSGLVHVRIFRSPADSAVADAPSEGDLMAGETDTLIAARAHKPSLVPHASSGMTNVIVRYEALTLHAGSGVGGGTNDNFAELRSSRFIADGRDVLTYVRRWVWNGTGSRPVARGDAYVSGAGINLAAAQTINITPDWNAGRLLVSAEYPVTQTVTPSKPSDP